ncbi:bifunctional diaminohydroxyphosphoribosylaminopyrimidine deaminase/5-amino-6-(5-phosphoribosylamino)uracil reductase RibD [Pseudoroseicyclus tamaricis]|uniref:Riboflavin biosynthesis protein RibD n=1 Tax=Pseudoroseicyclus tamaricis TaxID=2705421 RepID=A0A6B2JZP4_9RHOB|nr:bifunctional diaminohydroxyphosphoribosylaminopyrimidine deaminase/5-amino-6-(5-phosphoribosylamino)uracil reductase RibD [Pseudoroseicyclus tamaricis]
MAHALALGRRSMGQAWPNPAVGCVLVRDGRVVARGWTAPGGRPHAEAAALAAAGETARGATAYVTLEPCAHHGQTPPCAEALVAAGVSRVVIAAPDPDPRVAGKGAAILRAAGVEVVEGVRRAEAELDLAGFLSRFTTGRPWLTLKLAATLDGRIATATGESKWITGPRARAEVQALRARHDAVMVGGGTARADDPRLTLRGMGERRAPVRVVLSRRLDLPVESELMRTARGIPVWLVHGAGLREAAGAPFAAAGAELVEAPVAGGQIDPAGALEALAARGLTRVFCEGGGGLAASLLGAGLVDELVLFTAGLAIGAEGTPALAAMGLGALAEAPRLALVESRAVGADVMSVWRRGG